MLYCLVNDVCESTIFSRSRHAHYQTPNTPLTHTRTMGCIASGSVVRVLVKYVQWFPLLRYLFNTQNDRIVSTSWKPEFGHGLAIFDASDSLETILLDAWNFPHYTHLIRFGAIKRLTLLTRNKSGAPPAATPYRAAPRGLVWRSGGGVAAWRRGGAAWRRGVAVRRGGVFVYKFYRFFSKKSGAA